MCMVLGMIAFRLLTALVLAVPAVDVGARMDDYLSASQN